jgi:hypothetical protein
VHRHTSTAGWVVSGINGVAVAIAAPVSALGTGILSALATVVVGALSAVAARVLWDVAGRVTTRLHLRAPPVDCPLAGNCPMLRPPRTSSHDLEAAARQTTPDKGAT